MSVPTSWTSAVIFMAMIVPGLSFATARVFFVGWRSPDYGPGARILDALYASAVFLVVYSSIAVVLIGGTPTQVGERAQAIWNEWPSLAVAVIAIGLLIVLPALCGWLVSARWRRFRVIKDGVAKDIVRQVNRSRPIPRAWDFGAFEAVTPRFVRIRTESGELRRVVRAVLLRQHIPTSARHLH